MCDSECDSVIVCDSVCVCVCVRESECVCEVGWRALSVRVKGKPQPAL